MIQTVGFLDDVQVRSVWYCHLGERRAKPTDLFGVFPPGLDLPPPCHNQRKGHPAQCCCADHLSAPRGSRTGTQGGVTTAEAGAIPRPLAELVVGAAEAALDRGRGAGR